MKSSSNSHFILLTLFLLILTGATAIPDNGKSSALWPLPLNYTFGNNTVEITSPCDLSLVIGEPTSFDDVLYEIFDFYKSKMFAAYNCSKDRTPPPPQDMITGRNYLMAFINTKDSYFPDENIDESYRLKANGQQTTIFAETYSGFVYALETFSQLLVFEDAGAGKPPRCLMPGVYLNILDRPYFRWRGLMLDTARHYYPKTAIYRLLDGLMYAKMNVFHWHISDKDSFPLQLETIPSLSKHGAFSPEQIYTLADVEDIVLYAAKRGIRVIPEIDSPSHTLSWSYTPEFSDMVTCKDGDGVLDPSHPLAQKVLRGIYLDIQRYFPDRYIHLGLDEIPELCWENDKIKALKKQKNIDNLFDWYQNLLRDLTPTKKRINWYTPGDMFKYRDDDILQYWGTSLDLTQFLANFKKNKVILSPSDVIYLDCGAGSYYGFNSWCGDLSTWRHIYETNWTTLVGQEALDRVLGVEAALWSELSNEDTLDGKIWPRLLALAEKLWNPEPKEKMARRMQAAVNRIRERGINSLPMLSGLCERNIESCVDI